MNFLYALLMKILDKIGIAKNAEFTIPLISIKKRFVGLKKIKKEDK